MKSPPVQFRDDVARTMVEAFITESTTPTLATQPEPALVA